MKRGLLLWLVLLRTCPANADNEKLNGQENYLTPKNVKTPDKNCEMSNSQKQQNNNTPKGKKQPDDAECYMKHVDQMLTVEKQKDSLKALQDLQEFLEDTEVNETTSMSVGRLVALLVKPTDLKDLKISVSNSKAALDDAVSDTKVIVQLPREIKAGPNNLIVFCMLTLPEGTGTTEETTGQLYENRLVGVSVSNMSVSGLQQRVNITMNLSTVINETQEPRCVFFNFSTNSTSSDGCQTLWKRGQSSITCSCDHLTYFAVLMVTPSISSQDQKNLTYITVIGCSLSLFALVATVVLFINRKARADVSMKVHINLVFALILLNVHFLPWQNTAALSSFGLCFYMALAVHYSLLATFSWLALEGVHLYILLIRVFNIYIRRYVLKLCVLGWGIPAVIVSLVLIINKDSYGLVSVDSSNSSDTAVCYITQPTVKKVAVLGVFGLVFVFNVIMLGVTIKRVMSHHSNEESNRGRAKRNILTLLGISTLLGITWGLIFFSFGVLTTVVQYLFCILNSLQGFFIFLWFVLSLRKTENPSTKTSSVARSTS